MDALKTQGQQTIQLFEFMMMNKMKLEFHESTTIVVQNLITYCQIPYLNNVYNEQLRFFGQTISQFILHSNCQTI